MILNNGLDEACKQTSAAQTTGSIPWPAFARFIRYAAYGNGSTEPQETDVELVNELARTADRGGFTDESDSIRDGQNDVLRQVSTFRRVFSISSSVNVTEWGLGVNSSGALGVRDLFREDPNDPNSDPVTLDLQSGDELHLIITLTVEGPYGYDEESFTITGTAGNDGNGLHTGQAGLCASNDTNAERALRTAWPGGTGVSTWDRLSRITTDTLTGRGDSISQSGNYDLSAEVYTDGNYYRDHTAILSTAQANEEHWGWINGSDSGFGSRFFTTNPPSFTKTDTYELRLTVRKFIERA